MTVCCCCLQFIFPAIFSTENPQLSSPYIHETTASLSMMEIYFRQRSRLQCRLKHTGRYLSHGRLAAKPITTTTAVRWGSNQDTGISLRFLYMHSKTLLIRTLCNSDCFLFVCMYVFFYSEQRFLLNENVII
jgi:hypothetical protein